MTVRAKGTSNTHALKTMRSLMLALSLTAARTRRPTSQARSSTGRTGIKPTSIPPARIGARLKTIHASPTMVGSHADGELVSSSAAIATTRMPSTTTRFGTPTTMSMRRIRPRSVVGACARRARALSDSTPLMRCAGSRRSLRCPRSECSALSPRPRTCARGRADDLDWGLVFLFIGVHFATAPSPTGGGAAR